MEFSQAPRPAPGRLGQAGKPLGSRFRGCSRSAIAGAALALRGLGRHVFPQWLGAMCLHPSSEAKACPLVLCRACDESRVQAFGDAGRLGLSTVRRRRSRNPAS